MALILGTGVLFLGLTLDARAQEMEIADGIEVPRLELALTNSTVVSGEPLVFQIAAGGDGKYQDLRARVFSLSKRELPGRPWKHRSADQQGDLCYLYLSQVVRPTIVGSLIKVKTEGYDDGPYTVVFERGKYQLRGVIQIKQKDVARYFERGYDFEVTLPREPGLLTKAVASIAQGAQRLAEFFSRPWRDTVQVSVDPVPQAPRLREDEKAQAETVAVCVRFEEQEDVLRGTLEVCPTCGVEDLYEEIRLVYGMGLPDPPEPVAAVGELHVPEPPAGTRTAPAP